MVPTLQEWVSEDRLARFVSEVVDEALDLSSIYSSYEEERGFPAYDPRLMVKLLIYGYATGTAALADVHGVSQAGCAAPGAPSGATTDASRSAPGRPDAPIPVTASGGRTQGQGGNADALGTNC
jgi:hypothetical protein